MTTLSYSTEIKDQSGAFFELRELFQAYNDEEYGFAKLPLSIDHLNNPSLDSAPIYVLSPHDGIDQLVLDNIESINERNGRITIKYYGEAESTVLSEQSYAIPLQKFIQDVNSNHELTFLHNAFLYF